MTGALLTHLSGRLSRATLPGPHLGAEAAEWFATLTRQALTQDQALILDLSRVRRSQAGGLWHLAELARDLPDLALTGLSGKLIRHLDHCGLSHVFQIFPTVAAAQTSPWGQQHQISDVTAVLLCGRPTGVDPLGNGTPAALAPMLGGTVMGHLLDQLTSAGVRRAILTPCEGGEGMQHRFGRRWAGVLDLEYMNLRDTSTAQWRPRPLPPLAALQHIHRCTGALGADVLMIDVDALYSGDFAGMISDHRQADAGLSLAHPQATSVDRLIATNQRGGPQPKGAVVLRAELLDQLSDPKEGGFTGLFDQVPPDQVRAPQGQPPLQAAALTDPVTYARTLRQVLCQRGEGADRAAAFVDPAAQVGRGTRLIGPCVLSPAAHVGRACVLTRCVVLPGAVVPDGTERADHVFGRDFATSLADAPAPPLPPRKPWVAPPIRLAG